MLNYTGEAGEADMQQLHRSFAAAAETVTAVM